MKKVLLISLLALFLFSCNNSTQKEQTATNETQEKNEAVMSIDELMDNADSMVDQVVTVKGTVMHVCKHSGARCFLMGSNEDINIRIEAGDKIGAFENEQMGKDLTIRGTLRAAQTELEEGEHEHNGDDNTALHEPKGENNVVYYIDGIELIETDD